MILDIIYGQMSLQSQGLSKCNKNFNTSQDVHKTKAVLKRTCIHFLAKKIITEHAVCTSLNQWRHSMLLVVLDQIMHYFSYPQP